MKLGSVSSTQSLRNDLIRIKDDHNSMSSLFSRQSREVAQVITQLTSKYSTGTKILTYRIWCILKVFSFCLQTSTFLLELQSSQKEIYSLNEQINTISEKLKTSVEAAGDAQTSQLREVSELQKSIEDLNRQLQGLSTQRKYYTYIFPKLLHVDINQAYYFQLQPRNGKSWKIK